MGVSTECPPPDDRSAREAGPPLCPRCGYDQSGAAARWQSACDLAGTCPECGLRFEWADLLCERRARVPGFVEHPGHGRAWLGAAFLWRALRTWAWTVWPPRFFARVRMHHRVSLARMLLWLPALCAAMYAAAAGCMFVGAFVQAGGVAPAADALERATIETVNDSALGVAFVTPRWTALFRPVARHVPVWLLPGLAAWAVAPLLLLALSDTRRLVKVRPVHVLRAAVYGCAWVVPLFALRLANRAGMVVLVSLDRWVFASPRALYVRTHWLGALLPAWSGYALAAAAAVWMAWWWYLAITRGMRLPRPVLTWALVVGTSFAVGGAVLLLDWRMVRFLG